MDRAFDEAGRHGDRWQLKRKRLTEWTEFFTHLLTSSIFIQFVNLMDRKCSTDSELSDYEGISAVGTLYWIS